MKIRDLDLDNTEHLDEVLAQCVAELLSKQKENNEYWGKVSAAVVDPNGRAVYGVNHLTKDGTRKHAERVAIENYEDKFGKVSPECIIVTTLSPCSAHMSERWGESCTELLNEMHIKKVYIGHSDEKQEDTDVYRHKQFRIQQTKNPKLRKLCESISNLFLK